MLLQDATTRLLDHVSLVRDAWKRFSEDEKSVFCPPSSTQATEPSPAEMEVPTSTEAAEPATAYPSQPPPAAEEDSAVPQAMSVNPNGKANTAASCYGERDDDDYYEDDPSKNKQWNCYTVFIKEGLAKVHLTKVRP